MLEAWWGLSVGRGSRDGRLGFVGDSAVSSSMLGRVSVGRGNGASWLGFVGGFSRFLKHDGRLLVGRGGGDGRGGVCVGGREDRELIFIYHCNGRGVCQSGPLR